MLRKKKTTDGGNGGKICGICNKCFANGKAVGGHMRTHFAKLPIPPKPAPITPPITPTPSDISKVDVDSKSNSMDDQGTELDQSSMTRKRSKRCCKIDNDATIKVLLPPRTKVDEHNPKQTGSAFDSFFAVINAALTLISLSKENWPEGEALINKKQKVKDVSEQEDSYVEAGDEFHGERFECEMSKKVYGSYHALGGHKAHHKMFMKNDQSEAGGEFVEQNWDGAVFEIPKYFKCPYCSRVLGSSQALGRHKKIHFPNAMNFDANDIDLNSPAPVEDNEGNIQGY